MSMSQSSRKILVSQENVSPKTLSNEDRKTQVQPRAPRSAFICFADARKKEIINANGSFPTGTKDVLNLVAKQWRALSQRERGFWDEEAREDKLRYVREKAEYRGILTSPKRRAKKNPKAPKRPMSAFLKFSQTRRGLVKTENPDMENTDVSRLLGEMWRNASPAEKKPYIEQEQRERAEYKTTMKKWKEEQAKKEDVSSWANGHQSSRNLDDQTENPEPQPFASSEPNVSGQFESLQIQTVEEALHKVDERMNPEHDFRGSRRNSNKTSDASSASPRTRYTIYQEPDQENARASYYHHSPFHVHSVAPENYDYYGFGAPSQTPRYYPRPDFHTLNASKYYGEQKPQHFGSYNYP